jgi:aldehyde dehydrogenase (NAD+)
VTDISWRVISKCHIAAKQHYNDLPLQHLDDGINLPEFGANMGSMVSIPQRDRAESMVMDAVAEGGKIIAGGRPPNRDGAFFEPNIIDCEPDNSIAGQDVFGSVLSVMRFDQDDEAIAIANNTDYGLVAGVFTKDLNRATRAAAGLRAGQVFINECYAGGVKAPFGGYGKSGYGREKGREALWNYVQTKNIAIKR